MYLIFVVSLFLDYFRAWYCSELKQDSFLFSYTMFASTNRAWFAPGYTLCDRSWFCSVTHQTNRAWFCSEFHAIGYIPVGPDFCWELHTKPKGPDFAQSCTIWLCTNRAWFYSFYSELHIKPTGPDFAQSHAIGYIPIGPDFAQSCTIWLYTNRSWFCSVTCYWLCTKRA